jgi:hypothetical protein
MLADTCAWADGTNGTNRENIDSHQLYRIALRRLSTTDFGPTANNPFNLILDSPEPLKASPVAAR